MKKRCGCIVTQVAAGTATAAKPNVAQAAAARNSGVAIEKCRGGRRNATARAVTI